MVDRSETRTKIDARLQLLITSPYTQPQLQLSGLINRRGQIVSQTDYLRRLSPRKRQRKEREALTPELILRALKNDESHRRSRYHQFEVASRLATYNNVEILTRRRRKQSHGGEKYRQKSASPYSPKIENVGERRPRVSSAYNRKPKDNMQLSEREQAESRIEHLDQLNIPSAEHHVCEVTMSYGSPTALNTAESVRDEVIVMQQHSTGENLVIYRGFLSEGDSFSFKSRRRSTSTLTLAFYTKGFIHSVVNDCCEFRYGRRNHTTNEHSQFLVERIRNASPCEKCRTRSSRKAASPIVNNTATNTAQNTHSFKGHRRSLTPTPKITDNNHQGVPTEKPTSNSNERQENQKTTQQKRPSPIVIPIENNEKKEKQTEWHQQITTDRSTPVNFNLLELALIQEANSSIQLMQTNSTNSSTVQENTSRHSAELIEEKTSPTPSQQNQHIQEWVNRTDIIPINTHQANDNISVTDTGNDCQLLTADSPQESQPLAHRTPSNSLVRHETMVENFVYILDGTLHISDSDKTKLRGLINFGSTFNTINDTTCKEFLAHIVHEQIIMILSRRSIENLDRNIHDVSQLRFIYVVDNTKDCSCDFQKIRGIYTNIASVCDQVEEDIKLSTYDLTKILSVSGTDNENNSFAYTQVLNDILLEIDESTNLKREMLDFCRQEYTDNKIQLKFIDEFERHFRSDNAVRWYTREETFLYKMLTRAFRTPDPDILLKLRFFIQHLHRQLKSNPSKTPATVYRTQHISNDDFNRLLKNQGGLLAFSQFLSTHKSKVIAQKQIIDPSLVDSNVKLVHFQIELDITTPMMEFGMDSKQILISAATVFRLSTIHRKGDEILVVKLTANNETLQAVQEVTKTVRGAAHGSFPLLRMAKLMKQMKYMRYTEYFCQILIDHPLTLNDATANLTVGGLFHMLCCFYYEQKQYERALEHLRKSLTIYLRVLSPDDIKLTPTYNNMGSIYHKQGLDEQALHFHKKAYDIQVQSVNPDLDSVAAYASNIASVLVKQDKYEEAIPYFQRDLQIRQRLYPNGNDLQLSTKYHNLAGAQFQVKKYSKALENYRKCLAIEVKVHPSNHPTVAVTYFNMATVYEGLGRLEEAIEAIGKAIERLLLTRDDTDEEVRMYKDYEKRLRQKL